MKYERKCLCCGASYSYCNNCYDFRNYPLWMNSFHDENCKNIFETCTNYNFKLITTEQAKKALSNCDLSNQPSVEKKDFVKNEPIHEVVTKK